MLGIFHLKFWLKQAYSFITVTPKLETCMRLQSRTCSAMGCEAKPWQSPQLINTQSAAEVLISGKASHTPLITEPCQIKPRSSIENPLQHCRAALLGQNSINAEGFDGGSPTEQQTHS